MYTGIVKYRPGPVHGAIRVTGYLCLALEYYIMPIEFHIMPVVWAAQLMHDAVSPTATVDGWHCITASDALQAFCCGYPG